MGFSGIMYGVKGHIGGFRSQTVEPRAYCGAYSREYVEPRHTVEPRHSVEPRVRCGAWSTLWILERTVEPRTHCAA
jgi:hypothetical protein